MTSQIDFSLPQEFLLFLNEFNGGEGFVGENSYVILWKTSDLIEFNHGYMVNEFAPELFLIGSDGGGTAYAIRKIDGTFVQVPFIGMSIEESEKCGDDFKEFLEYLSNA
ncbi:hypothetical protein D3C72_2111440 [compost metagenome]